MRQMFWCTAFVVGLLTPVSASAAPVVAYFTDFNASSTAPAAGITANGFTPLQITNISTYNFSSASILVINESNNSGLSAALNGRLGDLATFVQGGGRLIVHDRFVSTNVGDPQSNPFLVGAAGILVDRDFSNDANIDIVPPGGTQVTNGPFGTLTNTSLDGGTSSSHGFALLSSFPVGAQALLRRGTSTNEIVAFDYAFGNGFVFYSTIPLDFYLAGAGPNPPQGNFANVYYPNVLSFVNGLGAAPTPEPTTLAVFGLMGAAGFGYIRRRLKGAPVAV